MSNEMQARLTGDFKLLVGVNMSMNDYLSLWPFENLARVYPAFCPMTAGVAPCMQLVRRKWTNIKKLLKVFNSTVTKSSFLKIPLFNQGK